MPSPSERERRLADEVAAALRPADDVPVAWRDAAKASWTWRTVDAELAALVHDVADELAGARGQATGSALLVFEAPGLTLSVEVRAGGEPGGDAAALRCQLLPAGAATVLLEGSDGSVALATSLGHGAFTVTPRSSGPVRLRVLPAGPGSTVLTSWFRAG